MDKEYYLPWDMHWTAILVSTVFFVLLALAFSPLGHPKLQYGLIMIIMVGLAVWKAVCLYAALFRAPKSVRTERNLLVMQFIFRPTLEVAYRDIHSIRLSKWKAPWHSHPVEMTFDECRKSVLLSERFVDFLDMINTIHAQNSECEVDSTLYHR